MKFFNKLFFQNALQLKIKFSMTVTHQSMKNSCWHYHLFDIILTRTYRPELSDYFRTTPNPRK
jgi:hypothetical protein